MRIFKQCGVISAHIQADRQADRGMNARASGIKQQFAYRNSHAAYALVAQAKNAFIIRNYQQSNIAVAEIMQPLSHLATVCRTQKQPARASKNMAVSLAGQTDRRSIDDRRQPLQVLDQYAKKECFISTKQRNQPDILLEWIALGKKVLQFRSDLLLDRKHRRR